MEEWKHLEDIVAKRLKHKYWGFETINPQYQKGNSKPDFVVNGFWLVGRVLVEAKHKSTVAKDDIDKLARDARRHKSDYNHLYISTTTKISDDMKDYAKKKNIEVYRLGMNGKEKRIV